MGGDAVALYPSMDNIGTSEIVTRAVIQSKVEFRNIDYRRLLIYLYLLLGRETLNIYGLGQYTPVRCNWVKSKAKSLASKINRNLDNWVVNITGLTEEEKRLLIKSSNLAKCMSIII